jgi:hypothetical protein
MYCTVKPSLVEPYEIDVYVIALAHDSLPAALAFQRTFPEGGDTKGRLVRKILEWYVLRMFLSLFFFEELVFIIITVTKRLPDKTKPGTSFIFSLSHSHHTRNL